MHGRTTVPPDGLSPIQVRVITTLAGLQPAWTLTGGAALVGVHGLHRTTRDVDLFFHGRDKLGDVPEEAARRLVASGFEVVSLQAADTFRRYRVSDGSESVILDLVAEPIPVIESPMSLDWGGIPIFVDTRHEILVNKLCALVHRAELRDLSDVCDLLATGGDLARAMQDAPKKEAGFSALTLAWLLRQLPVPSLAEAAGMGPEAAQTLASRRDELLGRLTQLTRPDA